MNNKQGNIGYDPNDWNDEDLPPPPPLGNESQETPLISRVAFPKGVASNHFPALFTRSSIFCASPNGATTVPVHIESMPHYTVMCQGPRLGMRDKTIWEAAVEAGRKHKWLADPFTLSLSAVAARIGTVDRSKQCLDAIFARLVALTQVTVSYNQLSTKGTGSGKMLLSVTRNVSGSALVMLDPDLILPAYENDQRLLSRPDRRSKFPTAVGKWIHDYLSGSNQSGGFALLDLQAWSGCSQTPAKFAASLKEPLTMLADPAALGETSGAGPVKSFRWDKPERKPQTWVLHVERGAEKVGYSMSPTVLAQIANNKKLVAPVIEEPTRRSRYRGNAQKDSSARRRSGPSL